MTDVPLPAAPNPESSTPHKPERKMEKKKKKKREGRKRKDERKQPKTHDEEKETRPPYIAKTPLETEEAP
jgi:hypothetical protein